MADNAAGVPPVGPSNSPPSRLGQSSVRTQPPGQNTDPVAEATRDAAKAGQKASEAAQKAAPTGKDIPEIAAGKVEGHQTAITKDHQPKDQDSLRASGAQVEPALLAADGGSIPHAMVSSPSGLVPASAVGGAEALAQYEARLKADLQDKSLTEEKLLSMNKHEIRSAAHDRGYKIGEGSVRSLTTRFLAAQAAEQGNSK